MCANMDTCCIILRFNNRAGQETRILFREKFWGFGIWFRSDEDFSECFGNKTIQETDTSTTGLGSYLSWCSPSSGMASGFTVPWARWVSSPHTIWCPQPKEANIFLVTEIPLSFWSGQPLSRTEQESVLCCATAHRASLSTGGAALCHKVGDSHSTVLCYVPGHYSPSCHQLLTVLSCSSVWGSDVGKRAGGDSFVSQVFTMRCRNSCHLRCLWAVSAKCFSKIRASKVPAFLQIHKKGSRSSVWSMVSG